MFGKIQKLKQGKIDPNELLHSLSMETNQNITVKQPEKKAQNKSVVPETKKKELAPVR